MSLSPEPLSASKKKKEFEIENIWDFMKLDSLSEDRLQNSILQLYIEIKI